VDGTVEVRLLGGEHPEARRLLAAMEAEGARTYGPFTGDRTSMVSPGELVPPRGQYVALWAGDAAVAGGGVRSLPSADRRLAEIKRMWVDPAWRGRGLGHRLLAELEAAAVRLGFEVLRLDTAGALAGFYARSGYAPVADYNGNGYATFWGEKVLAGGSAGEGRERH
jgi:GNAT superfamily N-acetyltransferase